MRQPAQNILGQVGLVAGCISHGTDQFISTTTIGNYSPGTAVKHTPCKRSVRMGTDADDPRADIGGQAPRYFQCPGATGIFGDHGDLGSILSGRVQRLPAAGFRTDNL